MESDFTVTVRVRNAVVTGLTMLPAEMLILNVPAAKGVPARVAVPSPWSVSFKPSRLPAASSSGGGNPVVCTANVSGVPTTPESANGPVKFVDANTCCVNGSEVLPRSWRRRCKPR